MGEDTKAKMHPLSSDEELKLARKQVTYQAKIDGLLQPRSECVAGIPPSYKPSRTQLRERDMGWSI